MIAGSLFKNAGGGMAKTGGYIVGRKDLIERISYRFTVPGLGGAEGATFGSLRDMFQGFFISPQTTGNAIKGAIFEAALLEELGLSVSPKWDAPRTDLIQTVNFGNPDDMIKFAAAIQANSPIDSFVTPIPETMAGYEDPVIMAGGSFVSGSTTEFSGDGPLREPYTLYMQGGLTFAHVKVAIIGPPKPPSLIKNNRVIGSTLVMELNLFFDWKTMRSIWHNHEAKMLTPTKNLDKISRNPNIENDSFTFF